MRMPTRLICLLAALAIAVPTAALPAVAFGQSAGDDQYVDPFQDNGNNGKHHNKSQQGGNDNSSSQQGNSQTAAGGGGSGSDSGSGGSGSSGTAGASASQSDPNGDDSSLPHTGSGLPEAWLVVGGVILLLGGGFLLRRVWPRPE
jgi:LPXTG-motif cell wall-anchored protein